MKAVIEAAREYGFFVHREDVAALDWTVADFPVANVWYDLDLTPIVPENAHAVLLQVIYSASGIDTTFELRRKGYTQDIVQAQTEPQVAWIRLWQDRIIGIGPDRVIQGKKDTNKPNRIDIVVKGWWF